MSSELSQLATDWAERFVRGIPKAIVAGLAGFAILAAMGYGTTGVLAAVIAGASAGLILNTCIGPKNEGLPTKDRTPTPVRQLEKMIAGKEPELSVEEFSKKWVKELNANRLQNEMTR